MAKKAKKLATKSTRRKSKAARTTKKSASRGLSALRHLTLRNVRLIELKARIEVTDGKMPNKPSLESGVSVGPSQGEGIILVDGHVKIDSRPAGDEKSKSSLVIEVHYQCVYAVEGVEVNSLADSSDKLAASGMLIMWPHFREAIQSISGKMGIPPITLPMFLANIPGSGKGMNVTLGSSKN